jgi:hypothetical protein
VVFFPLDEQLALSDKHWSEGVVKETVWLSGVVDSYGEVAAILQRVGRVNLSPSSVWRRVEKWGSVLQTLEAEQASKATALAGRSAAPVMAPVEKRLGAAMDGAMVNIRNEGWKELKAGCGFAIEQQTLIDPYTQEAVEQGQATQLPYVAHLGGPAELGQQLWAEAQRRGWEQAVDPQVLGDGAAWIWQLSDLDFAPQQQTVDWYHATEHLHAAAQLVEPVQQRTATRWYNAAETLRFQGQGEQLLQQLTHCAERLPTQAKDLPLPSYLL